MKGRPAPLSVVMMHADGLHVAQIGRRHGRDRRWARRLLLEHELYCFGRPAWIGRYPFKQSSRAEQLESA